MDNNSPDFNAVSPGDLQAKLGFLKSQVTPHVLFNTLSFIKYAISHEPDAAEDAVSRLADLLSYGINQEGSESVLLGDEVEQMENMVALQKMRFDGRQKLSFSVEFDRKGIRIMPLVFISLLENVFRHGNALRKDSATQIELKLEGNCLVFLSSNPVAMSRIQEKTGNGLDLIRQRLKTFYQGDFTFEYGMSGDYFNTLLKIPLSCR